MYTYEKETELFVISMYEQKTRIPIPNVSYGLFSLLYCPWFEIGCQYKKIYLKQQSSALIQLIILIFYERFFYFCKQNNSWYFLWAKTHVGTYLYTKEVQWPWDEGIMSHVRYFNPHVCMYLWVRIPRCSFVYLFLLHTIDGKDDRPYCVLSKVIDKFEVLVPMSV